jgi:hypothetical protein
MDVPHDVLQTVADRLNGSVTDATLVCNILSLILIAQRKRNTHAPTLKHVLRHANGENRIVLQVLNLYALEATDISALRALSHRVLSLRFQFTSQANGDLLGHGLLVVDLLHSAVPRVPPMPVYTEPAARRALTTPIDWTNSSVHADDRAMVLRVVGDVYNMHHVMPMGITVSMETLDDIDYTRSVVSKRKRDDDEPQQDESDTTTQAAPTVGYCLHFMGVPSFDDSYLAHMAQKYATLWLGATVLFPHTRKHGELLVPAQLVVSLRCQHALVQASQPRAVCGAKRLCKKIYTEE